MAQANERIFVIPLRKEWLKVPKYRRAGRATKTVKKFIAKHMKVPDRDEKKVKLDIYFNNDLWFKGRRKPPAKVKVKAVKDGDIVKVDFVEVPETVKFLKAKHEKRHKKSEKKPEVKSAEEKPEEKTEEKKEEEEKGKAVEVQHEKEFKAMEKQQKHVLKKPATKGKQPTEFRKALKK